MTTQEKQELPQEEPVAKAPEEQPTDESLMESMEEELEAEEKGKTPEVPAPAEAPPVEPEAEKEAKPKKKKEEEDIVEEKTYTIPLGKALIMPPRKRAPRAMRMVRAYVIKHMKIPTRGEEEDEAPPTLTVTQQVNERIWGRGIEKPPRKIRVRAAKDSDGNVTVHLAEAE